MFHFILFVNAGTNIPGEKLTDVQQGADPLKHKGWNLPMASSAGALDLKKFRISPARALENVEKQEKLYVDYGPDYSFSKAVTD